MRRIIYFVLLLLAGGLSAQSPDSAQWTNGTETIMNADGRLVIGGYGEVHYNQPLDLNTRQNGSLDVHRMVMLMGYKFDSRTQFVTEIEFEHVKEVYVEQAFLQYKVSPALNLRGGLLLIPFGLINEYHEPIYFHSVERPAIDSYIVPTTWREIGLGINGSLIDLSLNYKLYLVNGLNGFDSKARFTGDKSLRGGRQKGAESYISSPSLTGRIDFFGLPNIRLGVSGYLGNSQSTLYDGINRKDVSSMERADSSIVTIGLAGADIRYSNNGFSVKGQYYFGSLQNAGRYNQFVKQNTGIDSDLGSAITGYYIEIAYNVFRPFDNINSSLHPFVRFESLNTHYKVGEGESKNPAMKRMIITSGLNWFPTAGSVVKMDFQLFKSADTSNFDKQLNVGIGVLF